MAVVGTVIAAVSVTSYSTPNTPVDTQHIDALHQRTTTQDITPIENDKLALYVDYSNCIADGMHSPFYQNMVSPLTAATKEYWSIKGDAIEKQEGSVFSLLNNVEEVNYAALDKAIEKMADSDTESVLLTDGELFTQTATKDNPNNPYMHNAFKKWLLKGHDIHIIAEPYQEVYKGQTFKKKRFYIVFTDDRLEGNIYDRIKKIVDFEQFPQVDEFHLSGNYPWIVPENGQASIPNDIVGDNVVTPRGEYEIQDWQVDWKNIINLVVNACDEQGNPLPNGDKIIGGLKINKNAFGAYRISDIGVKVTNINDEYFNLYNDLEAGQKGGNIQLASNPIENFIIVDKDEFKKHGMANLYFDINKFAPDADLNGNPFNYFKIEIVITGLEDILGNSIDMFNFDSLSHPGQTNISISESLKNTVFDPEIKNKLVSKTLYTIYVKSDKY